MPIIITINSLKGGTSKSTLSLNLYHYFAKEATVAIVDTDNQGSIIQLTKGKEDINVIPREAFSTWEEIQNLEGVDIIIIDTPPFLNEELSTIFSISNFILIPTMVSPLDALSLNADNSTLEMVGKAQATNHRIKAGIILTKVIHGTSFPREVREVLEGFSKVPILESEMGVRVDYARSLISGNSVYSTENKKAQKEIESIGEEIIKILSHE